MRIPVDLIAKGIRTQRRKLINVGITTHDDLGIYRPLPDHPNEVSHTLLKLAPMPTMDTYIPNTHYNITLLISVLQMNPPDPTHPQNFLYHESISRVNDKEHTAGSVPWIVLDDPVLRLEGQPTPPSACL